MSADIAYRIRDRWTTSPAERLRDEYERLVRDLNNIIRELEREMERLNALARNPLYTKEPSGEWKGRIIKTFHSKQRIVIEQMNRLYKYYAAEMEELIEKRNYAQRKYNDYVWYCQNEDAREKEYAEWEIR